NEFDNDGCSTSCKIEGTCETPYDFRAMAIYSPQHKQRLVGDVSPITFASLVSPEVNQCGQGNRSAVFLYRNGSERGYLSVGGLVPEGLEPAVSIAVRKTCDAPASEQICRIADGMLSETMIIAPEEEVYI